MSDELEALAARGAEAHAAQTAQQQTKAAAEARLKPKMSRLLRRSLSASKSSLGLWIVAMGAMIAAGVAVGELLEGTVQVIAFAVLTVVFGGGMFAAVKISEQRGIERSMSWLDGLPFDLDRTQYLDALEGERFKTQVELRVVFETPPGDTERGTFADAASGAASVAERRWNRDRLIVISEVLDTHVSGNADRDSYFTNGRAHMWTMAMTDGALKLIHARQPIARVEVEMSNSS